MSADVAVMNAATARALTDRIKVGVEAIWEMIKQAYTLRAWDALGYESWDDYCTREFGTSRIRLPREERPEVVASLREAGLSIRAIAAATGDGVGTVHDALSSGVQNRTPITGTDGKTYTPPSPKPAPSSGFITPDDLDALNEPRDEPAEPDDVEPDEDEIAEQLIDNPPTPTPAPTPSKPRQRPLPQQMQDVAWDIRQAAERLSKLATDERFPKNKQQASALIRGHLLYVSETVTAVLSQLDQ